MIVSVTKGRAKLERGRWFLHGPGKVGKSTCASGWPGHIFLPTEHRIEHIPNVHHLPINENWLQFKEQVKWLDSQKQRNNYRTVVVDVIDHLWTYCVAHTCKKLGIDHQSDSGYGKGWDAVDKEFKDVFYRLLSYPYGLIVVSHSTMKEVTTMNSSYMKRVSTLPDRARKMIIPHMGVIGYIDFDTFIINQGGKKRAVPGRSITFQGDEYIEAGDGEGLLPKKLRLYKDATKTYDMIKSYYTGERKAVKD